MSLTQVMVRNWGSRLDGTFSVPAWLPEVDIHRALWSARKHGEKRVRLGAITVLVEDSATRDEPLRQIRDSATTDGDVTIQGCALRLLGFLRCPADLRLLTAALKSTHPEVREAAADGLAFGRDPQITEWLGYNLSGNEPTMTQGGIAMSIPPNLVTGVGADVDGDGIADPLRPILWTPEVREKLIDGVIRGPTSAERNAAAMALAVANTNPSNLKLRFAEWGVWHFGQVQASVDAVSMNALFDESSRTAVDPRQSGFHVLYANSNLPLVARLALEVSRGRITHASPLPDASRQSVKRRYEGGVFPTKWNKAMDPFVARREPYAALPWLDRYIPPDATDLTMSVGFQWRSLIVLPVKAPWMAQSTNSDDLILSYLSARAPEGSAWLSSHNESGRFLRYRSATRLLPGPSVTTRNGTLLLVRTTDVDQPAGVEEQPDYASVAAIDALDQTARRSRRTQRRGMYVTVAGGKVTGEIVPVPASGKQADPSTHTIGTGKAVQGEAELREWVIDAGLSPAEADGMLFAWRKPFFETDGKRFILLMSAVDYDSLCPISIQPKPTEMARVGVVWTELGGAPGATRPSGPPTE
ncbi:HEAT repeat domain-containing protein [Humisphaera borealis]|uniref:HEAT repeat domain-containing protein n=1 Tax=Humisphaera borealis TaxID=2807512 RepID=A0A7M2WU62_9BACT|nr:HEAT repeat domain-containing protein [Humisphaera borealis]QOV88993.1 HEAT repeat domain-containing protein [Humisphaera borealis]